MILSAYTSFLLDVRNFICNGMKDGGLYCPPLIPTGIRGIPGIPWNEFWLGNQPKSNFHSGGIQLV